MLLNTVTGNAGLIAAAFAEKLLGRQVITQEWGLTQGGLCTVIAMTPDFDAPEIVCQVQHDATGEEIGIFADEVLSVIEPNSDAAFADVAMLLASSQKLVERQKDQIAQLIDLADERFSRLEMVGGAA